MSCLLCGEAAAPEANDPRLPLLRVVLCIACRDRVAGDVGWRPAGSRGRRVIGARLWWRLGRLVEVPV